jgi:predicted acyltransferase
MARSAPSQRLTSLDAFRGITIAGMILVNNPGSWQQVYPPLQHKDWHGWTPTDLVFPFFIFIVGVAMAFSLGHRLRQGTMGAVHRQIVRRALLIFALGLLLSLFPSFDFSSLRVAGVLQRIAVVYFFAALMALHFSARAQAWIAGTILIFYWAIMKLIPVPGFGAGVLTPEGNLAAYIDSFLLPGRMWQGTWDPEGLLGTLPAISTALLGLLTGHWLRSERPRETIACGMFVAGWGGILLGLLWGIWFPINKPIWTSSFVLFTAGAALQFLGVCYWLIDVRDLRRWAYPAVVYGMNAITVYVASELLTGLLYAVRIPVEDGAVPLWTWLYRNAFLSWAEPMNASVFMAFLYVVLWFLLMDILYRRKIFIKI